MKIFFWLDFDANGLKYHGSQADIVKLATLTRESWHRAGWETEILKARDASDHFDFNGVMLEAGDKQPVWLHDWLFALRDKGGGWFTEADVWNNAFTPADALEYEGQKHPGFISLKRGFGFGAFYASGTMVQTLIDLLYAVDSGRLAPGIAEFPNLETIVRQHCLWRDFDVIQFPFCDEGWKRAKLLHLTRTAVQFWR